MQRGSPEVTWRTGSPSFRHDRLCRIRNIGIVEGSPTGPHFVSNHVSYLDPLVICSRYRHSRRNMRLGPGLDWTGAALPDPFPPGGSTHSGAQVLEMFIDARAENGCWYFQRVQLDWRTTHDFSEAPLVSLDSLEPPSCPPCSPSSRRRADAHLFSRTHQDHVPPRNRR